MDDQSGQSVGAILRAARQRQGRSQADVAAAAGYSASALSRIELGRRRPPLDVVAHLAHHYGVPLDRLGLARVDGGYPSERDDDVRRRTFLAAAATLTVPSWVLTRFDDALVALPTVRGPVTAAGVEGHLARLLGRFGAASYGPVAAELPDLLAAAHELAETSPSAAAKARTAACYDLATRTMTKLGRLTSSRVSADRALTAARASGSPLAVAMSTRALGVVLRHEARADVAFRTDLAALAAVEATGLTTTAQRTVFTQLACSTAYAAGQAGDRGQALELLVDADRAVRGLPEQRSGQTAATSLAQVRLYRVGIHWALGDSARALESARGLRPEQFDTAERRGRLHTDLARAWWQHDRPERAAVALLAAHREAPAEVTDRPAIRDLARDLVDHHSGLASARELRVALRRRPDGLTS